MAEESNLGLALRSADVTVEGNLGFMGVVMIFSLGL